MLFEPGVELFAASRPVAHVVVHAINLDRESRLCAVKVDHVGSDRMLTTEHWLSRRTLAQSIP
jgi:hypothetical protein